VIETFHELGAGERRRDEGGRRESVQLFKGELQNDASAAFAALVAWAHQTSSSKAAFVAASRVA
jgi:hypothetical protein